MNDAMGQGFALDFETEEQARAFALLMLVKRPDWRGIEVSRESGPSFRVRRQDLEADPNI